MEKQRLKYAEFLAARDAHPKNERGTLAWVIERVITDVQANPDMKQYGDTKVGRLRLLQGRFAIGKKMAAALTKLDYREHVKTRRREDGINQATAMHDLSSIATTLDHYMETWDDLDLAKAKVQLTIAKKSMVKQGLVGKANARKRRPTEEEIDKILAACMEHDASKYARVKLTDFVLMGLASSRRRGEICRITWGDVDFEGKQYWVRDLKHPTKKKGNDKKFLLWPEIASIIKRQPRIDPNDPAERIFKVRPNSVSSAYCNIKNRLGIEDLRLHDNRRECITRWLMKYRPDEVKLWGSGHEQGSKTLETNYDGRDPLEVAKASIPEFAEAA